MSGMISKSKLHQLAVSLASLKYSLLGITSDIECLQREVEKIMEEELPNSSSEKDSDGSLFPT
jgi:hypothetical protein